MANVLYTHSNPATAPMVIYNAQDNCYAMKIEVPIFEKKRHEHTTVRRIVNRDTGLPNKILKIFLFSVKAVIF